MKLNNNKTINGMPDKKSMFARSGACPPDFCPGALQFAG
jgi:hypothetical protein